MPTVEDILMTKGPDVLVAGPDDSVLTAAKLMAQTNVGSVIIKKEPKRGGAKTNGPAAGEGAIAGIFTERDLLCKVVAKGKDPAEVKLSQVMSSPVRTCRLSDDFQACVQIMARDRIRHLAVVEEGALVGVISIRDVLAAHAMK
jgi:CBS domain-containing protein